MNIDTDAVTAALAAAIRINASTLVWGWALALRLRRAHQFMPELIIGTLNVGGLARNFYPDLLETIGVEWVNLDLCFICES